MKKLKVFIMLSCLMTCISSMTFAAKFYDVKGTVYEGVTDRMAALGIMNGTSDRVFSAKKGLTRAELAKIVVYTRGLQDYADQTDFKPIFKDIKKHWARDYIYVAHDLGVLKGYEDGTFRPDKEVTYAEFIAIMMRSLGYLRLDDPTAEYWYTPYTKRMYEIGLDKGVPKYDSYNAPAKRGDVAIYWWNMLISDRWIIESENEYTGLTYTYSPVTQLEKLFPDYIYVNGRVNGIYEPGLKSGDYIGVMIGFGGYSTFSNVPILSYGAIGTGVYDTIGKELYGFSIDENLENYKVVSGPTFYLEELGYNLNKIRNYATYGNKNNASYAHLIVSNEDGSVLRAIFVDGSNSAVVEKIEIKYPEDDEYDQDSEYIRAGFLHLNESEDPFATTSAILIKNGQKVAWGAVPKNSVLTSLIDGYLYTYDEIVISNPVIDCSDLDELVINGDKYYVSKNCVYTIDEKRLEDEKTLQVFTYKKMNKKLFKSLLTRKINIYLNAAEEIVWIEFGKYKPENVIDKYDNGDYRVMYVDAQTYSAKEKSEDAIIKGVNLAGNYTRYEIKANDDIKVGSIVVLSEFEGNKPEKCEVINSNKKISDDISAIYEFDKDTTVYNNGAFGEYLVTEDTLIYRVLKIYEENSGNEVKDTEVAMYDSVESLGDLSKYKFVLFVNEEMNIDIVYAEREVNRTKYRVARVENVIEIKTPDETPDDKFFQPEVTVELSILGTVGKKYKAISGDCQEGELITFETDEKEEKLQVKERYKTNFIGYPSDAVVESFDRYTSIAKIKNSSPLNLKSESFEYQGKTYDLLSYKFVQANVKYNKEIGSWQFVGAKLYEMKDLELKENDRIVFDELNGVAVVYRGYTK